MKKWIVLAAALGVILATSIGVGIQRGLVKQAADLEAQPITVVIDAGHGGMDGGATTASGVCESQINLEIAIKTEYLLNLCGFSTKMIRNSDISIHEDTATTVSEKKVSDLKQRVEIVNTTPKAVLLSIHQNTFPEAQYHGAQVFYGKEEGSETWGKLTQEALVTTLEPTNNRQAKLSSKVYLMEHINCPGILVECGFLSNETEANLLQTPIYQTKLALTMASSLSLWQQEEQHHHEV